MNRVGFVIIALVLFSCNNKKSGEEGSGFSYSEFSGLFKASSLPYQVTDADVLSNKDTTVIRTADFTKFISDSIRTGLFGKNKVKYIAMAKLSRSKNTNYYIVKAIGGNKRVVLLLPFTDGKFDLVFPLLIPDADGTTSQVSSIDKSNGIVKMVSQRKTGGVVAEGRDVYQYVPEAKQFTLVLTNPLNNTAEVINPIDTLSRKSKYAGDYVKDKSNFVSVRDGRNPSQIMVFIHIGKGDCTGEIKSEMLMTSTTTAVYRQGGDPCSLSLKFTSNSVTLTEGGGCGSRRGLDCSFDGTFARKKEAKPKAEKKKSSSK